MILHIIQVTNTLKVGNIIDSSGNASAFVTGMILLWYGDTSNVPGGWVLCNGQVIVLLI